MALSQNTTLSRKLKKVLDLTLDDNLKTSLQAISEAFQDKAEGMPDKDRKNLRGVLENQTLQLHQSFLAEFKKANDQFQRVSDEIDQLVASCAKMQQALSSTRSESQVMVDQLEILNNELHETKTKEEQVKAFLQRFHLTPEERQTLKGDVTPAFFQVLDKVKDIHSHCADLLNAQHQQAGIEIMEMTYMQQMQGYDRLYKWTQQQTAEIMNADMPDVPVLYTKALHVLRDRGALWCQCMQEIAKVRKSTIVRKFSTVVTLGGKAIVQSLNDISSDDPLRYIGEMLAWVHQTVAEENDLVDIFFSTPATKGHHLPPSERPELSGLAADITMELSKADMLDQIFEGLVKLLKMRIEQLLDGIPPSNSSNLVVFFRLENLLQFYCGMVPPLLGQNAKLSLLLRDLKLKTLKKFFDILKAMSDKLLSSPLVSGADLSAPPVLVEAVAKLKTMMETLASSLIPPTERESEFAAVLSGIVDPLVSLLDKVEDLNRPQHATLSINCLDHIITTLNEQDFTRGKAAKLSGRLSKEMGRLVDHQADTLLRRCGLYDILEKERTKDPGTPLASYPTTSQEAVAEAIQGFYKFMYTMGSVTVPLCDKIQSPRLREEMSHKIVTRLCDAYEQVFSILSNPANGYTDAAKILQHKPANVRTLLDCSTS